MRNNGQTGAKYRRIVAFLRKHNQNIHNIVRNFQRRKICDLQNIGPTGAEFRLIITFVRINNLWELHNISSNIKNLYNRQICDLQKNGHNRNQIPSHSRIFAGRPSMTMLSTVLAVNKSAEGE